MDRKKKPTLADELDATRWDFQPGKDTKILLKPVGSVFKDMPWEIEPQYLGPSPFADLDAEEEIESDSDDDNTADTQPLEPLER